MFARKPVYCRAVTTLLYPGQNLGIDLVPCRLEERCLIKINLRGALSLIACACIIFITSRALAQFDALTCAPYKHGEIKRNVPTFFCSKKEDAEAYVKIMEKRRSERISVKEAQNSLIKFRANRECFHVATSHISKRTLHQGAGSAPYCNSLGFKATKWPSLIEAELSGDKSRIWILTHAIVPEVEN